MMKDEEVENGLTVKSIEYGDQEAIAQENIGISLAHRAAAIRLKESGQNSPEETLLDLMDLQRKDPEILVPVAFLTGVAGTGKTYLIRELLLRRPSFAVLCATTGIAAVNLNTTTINSLLKYFDTESLADTFVTGQLPSLLHKIGHEVENIVIDEVSMMDGRQLRILYEAVAQVNQYDSMRDRGKKLGIILTGDFCQLPPVKAPWVFEEKIWPEFARRTIRLTKVWRQGNEQFLAALNHLRAGEGKEATAILRDIVQWKSAVNRNFDGTTIVAKNDEVNRHNWLALNDLPGELIRIPSIPWGVLKGPAREKGEWKHIPPALEIKLGAYVMILSNATADSANGWSRELQYANGDCGWIESIDVQNKQIHVRLARNGKTVAISRITRYTLTRDEPSEYWEPENGEWNGELPYYDPKSKRWRLGGLTYMPLRLAYAATVHKCQGLTLDRIQVDSRAHFFGSPGMAYVALSRARSPENTHIVGVPGVFEKKVKIDEKVKEWL